MPWLFQPLSHSLGSNSVSATIKFSLNMNFPMLHWPQGHGGRRDNFLVWIEHTPNFSGDSNYIYIYPIEFSTLA